MRCRRHNLASADFVRSLHAPLPARPHHHAGRADHGRDCLKGEVATAGIADGVPTHAHPPVSFVVPAHDEARLLGATLDALHGAAIALNLSHEVLVVDDASTDATADIASDHGARVLRVEHRHIAATRNAGAHATTHPILVFVDADTLIDAPVLQAALSALEGGAVGGGAGVDFIGAATPHARALAALAKRVFRHTGIAPGCFIFCTRAAFEGTGGFDETWYAGEDVAISRALARQGRFVILRESVRTSERKLRTFGARDHLRLLWRFALRGRRILRDREALAIWYGQRRD